jgi:hypothetical protein
VTRRERAFQYGRTNNATCGRINAVGKFLRDHPIGGAALYIGPLLTIIGFVMDALHAAEVFPPPILEAIGLAIFFAGVIGILHQWYLKAISPAGEMPPLAASPQPRRPRIASTASAADRKASGSLFRAMIVGIAIIGAFFGSLVMYTIYRYGTYRDAIENTRLEIANTVIYPPGAPRLPSAAHGLFINYYTINRGFYTIIGPQVLSVIKYYDHQISLEDIDTEMKILDIKIGEPNKNGDEIYPNHIGPWFSGTDEQIDNQKWNTVIEGKAVILELAEIKYLVEGVLRITESCHLITKGFPATNNCPNHNRIFTKGH